MFLLHFSLPPEDEDNIEEMWKPNDSFFGKTVRFVTEKIKKLIEKLDKNKAKEPKTTTEFRWEFLKIDQSEWSPVLDLHVPRMPSAKAKKIVKG